MDGFSALCRVLGDDARLRILRLLSRERLNVGELTAILGLAQSGVSRHLALLRDAGLVGETREHGFTFYQPSRPPELLDLWALLDARFEDTSDKTARADDARLQEVLRVRKEQLGAGRQAGALMPGRSWAAWARALGHLLPPVDVADLGCGEGYLAIEAARWAKRVFAVDASAAVLDEARQLASRRGVKNITWKRGDIEDLPLADASVDVALLSQSLHHAEQPPAAIAEAVRVLRPGGRLLVLDLRSHDQAWTQERLGDRWPGFEDGELQRLLEGGGLSHVKVGVGASLRGNPFTVLIASGEKPVPRRKKEVVP